MKNKLLDSEELRSWTDVHWKKNLGWLLLDFLTAAGLISLCICFWHFQDDWGLPWALNIPVTVAVVFLVGCVQHRIGLMGHEASHYLLHPNRKTNDILGQLLCFFPVFGSLPKYRAKHLSHHLHPNDPEKDRNLHGARARKLYEGFPMKKRSFILQYYLKFFWPPFVLLNLFDLIRVVAIGTPEDNTPIEASSVKKKPPFYRSSAAWGIAFFILFLVVLDISKKQSFPIFALSLSTTFGIGLLGWRLLPETWFASRGTKNLAYAPRRDALLRMIFVSALATTLGTTFHFTGIWVGGYFLLLWIVPLVYVFPYLMLLREIYQHANADSGQLSNSRMMTADRFTRWAVLGYGNDSHLVHHLYPNIPHLHLRAVHERLLKNSSDYQTAAEETYGIVRSDDRDKASLLDALEKSKRPSG